MKKDGLFPLITNHHELEAAEILKMYKRQSYLEKRMYTKKIHFRGGTGISERRKTY